MLSIQEQRAWEDIQRFWAEEAEEPPRARRAAATLHKSTPRRLDDAPGLVVGGVWAAIFLVLFDARAAGLAVFAVTVAGLLLWRYRPLLWPAPAMHRGAAATDRPS